MKFPGNGYITHIQDPSVELDRVAYVAAGFFRFLYTEDAPPRRVADDLDYIYSALAGEPWEIVRVDGAEAVRETPEGETTYPVWALGQDSISLLRRRVADNDRVYVRNTFDYVSISRTDGYGRFAFRELWEVMQENPDVEFIVFGKFSFQLYFQFGMSGGALRVREAFSNGRPSGKIRRFMDSDGSVINGFDMRSRNWLEDAHIEHRELAGNRVYIALCLLLNVPVYIEELYSNMQRFNTPDGLIGDVYKRLSGLRESDFFTSVRSSRAPASRLMVLDGDKTMCDSCSLQYACRIYVEGGVCALPGSSGKKLSEYFNTRNSDDIMDGMSELLVIASDRLDESLKMERARMKREEEDPEKTPRFDPEIRHMINDIQKNAVQLAKLVNPNLTRPLVGVQINNNGGDGPKTITMNDITPQMQARAIRELEQAGTPRIEQTPQLLLEHIVRQQGGEILEGEVIGGVKRDF